MSPNRNGKKWLVLPFKVEYHRPLPKGHEAVQGDLADLRLTLLHMRPKGSFICDRASPHSAYKAARQVGVKITTRRMEDGTLCVWRVA